jgi:hypothetical protein
VLVSDGDRAGRAAQAAQVATVWRAGAACYVAAIPAVPGGKTDPADILTHQRAEAAVRVWRRVMDRALADTAWLPVQVVPNPGTLDARGRTAARDAAAAVLIHQQDTDLRDLVADAVAVRAGLAKKVMRAAAGAESAAARPGEDADGDSQALVRDGGFHAQVVVLLRAWLADQGWRPDAVGGWLDRDGKRISVKGRDITNAFLFRHVAAFESLTREDVAWRLDAVVRADRDARRAAILATILGKPASAAGAAELNKVLLAMTGHVDPIDLVAIKHWIWQVKRLQAHLPMAHDLMLILKGRQGSGKSTLTAGLCSPLAELVLDVNASHLTDERKAEALHDFAIGRWEEMQGAGKAEMAALKYTVSSRTMNYRELGSHTNNLLERRCAFIATTNEDASDLLSDTTGARRFYQIVTLDLIDRDLVNSIDWSLVWTSVSEHDDAPILAAHAAIGERQAALRHRDVLDLWLEADDLEPLVLILDGAAPVATRGPAGNDIFIQPTIEITRPWKLTGTTWERVGISPDHLLARYRHWARRCGQAQVAAPRFYSGLKARGWERQRPRTADGRAQVIMLPTALPDAWAVQARISFALPSPDTPSRGDRLRAGPSTREDQFARPAPAAAVDDPLGMEDPF